METRNEMVKSGIVEKLREMLDNSKMTIQLIKVIVWVIEALFKKLPKIPINYVILFITIG